MELHTPGGAESQKRRLASLLVSDRVSCRLAAGVSNILKVSLSTFVLASGKVDLQGKRMSSSLLDWDWTFSKERPGLSSTQMFNYLQGKGHPRSQDDLFPSAVVGVCGP